MSCVALIRACVVRDHRRSFMIDKEGPLDIVCNVLCYLGKVILLTAVILIVVEIVT